jgi:hypothetical protein
MYVQFDYYLSKKFSFSSGNINGYYLSNNISDMIVPSSVFCNRPVLQLSPIETDRYPFTTELRITDFHFKVY